MTPHIQRQHLVITPSISRQIIPAHVARDTPRASKRQSDSDLNILVYFSFLDKAVVKHISGAKSGTALAKNWWRIHNHRLGE
jgi:hypothetical protein